MAPTLRDATSDDVDAVVALVQSAYRGDVSRGGWTTEADLLDGQRTDAREVGALVTDPTARLLLMDDDDGLVGCFALTPTGRDGAVYLGMVAVRPRRQGDGLGSTMLSAAEAVAGGELGAHTVEMTVIRQRTELLAFYARRGYTDTGEERPFPTAEERFGVPRRDDLVFTVLAKPVGARPPSRK